MDTKNSVSNRLPRPAAFVLAAVFALGGVNLNLLNGSGLPLGISEAMAASPPTEDGAAHINLAVVGLAQGQTARISVSNSPDPRFVAPPDPIRVQMLFHDSRGNVIVDRAGRLVERTVVIEPHRSESLEINGNNLAAPGSRVSIVPCLRVLDISEGTLAIPTFEIYNNLHKATTVLSAGTLRGFDPQPDPPAPPEVAFGAVGLTQGVTARLHVFHEVTNSTRTSNPPMPMTLELLFHDTRGNLLADRSGREFRKIVILDPDSADFLDLDGNEIAAFGARVGIVPCVRVLRGSPGSRVALALETYVNLTRQTLSLANWVEPSGDDHSAPR